MKPHEEADESLPADHSAWRGDYRWPYALLATTADGLFYFWKYAPTLSEAHALAQQAVGYGVAKVRILAILRRGKRATFDLHGDLGGLSEVVMTVTR